MTKQEFAVIAMALQTYYPRFNLLPNDKALELWHEQLQDIDAKVMGEAVKKWASKEKWPPTIADLREQCQHTPYEMAFELKRREQLTIRAEERQRLTDNNKEMPEAVRNVISSISDILAKKMESKEGAEK